jgi:hypothetical protein
MFERCLRTLEATSYEVCCWIKSYDIDRLYPYPFKPLQRSASRHGYITLWKRFLSYVFRVWATPRNVRTEIYQLRLMGRQEDTISRIWAALDSCLGIQDRQESRPHSPLGSTLELGLQQQSTPTDTRSAASSPRSGVGTASSREPSVNSRTTATPTPPPPPPGRSDTRNCNLEISPRFAQQLTEWLFALSTQFVAQVGRPSSTDPLPLLDFTAVLGIHTYSLVYRSAYVFTPLLAGLVWVSRLLMLEYSLPSKAYTTAELNWPARDEYTNEIARLHEVRRRFLCRGGFHPTTTLMNMLSYGRSIARKEGRRTKSAGPVRRISLRYTTRMSLSSPSSGRCTLQYRTVEISSRRQCLVGTQADLISNLNGTHSSFHSLPPHSLINRAHAADLTPRVACTVLLASCSRVSAPGIWLISPPLL